MNKEIIFTDKEIMNFCYATRDFNIVHNPEFMGDKRKHVIVPGMLLFSYIMNFSKDIFKQGLDSFHILFNSIVNSYENISIGYEPTSIEKGSYYVFARNGRDSFSIKNERSRIFKREHDISTVKQGIYRNIDIKTFQLKEFMNLILCDDFKLAGFLFSVAYASNALNLSIEEPQTEVEHEINLLLDKTQNPDQVAPFYQKLDIYLNKNHMPLIPEGQIEYLIHFERETKNKAYIAHVRCEQEGNIIYHSKYRLIAIPDRLIMRLAKDK